jgi:PTH2 family peptidyl-tRNA hydrolase
LKGENKQHLLDLMQKAKESGLLHYLVSDAGHTQVAPGSNTVLSIFGKESDVNEITGKLKLL